MKEDTDEDSGIEDTGGRYNNLSCRQLAAKSEPVIRNNDGNVVINDEDSSIAVSNDIRIQKM